MCSPFYGDTLVYTTSDNLDYVGTMYDCIRPFYKTSRFSNVAQCVLLHDSLCFVPILFKFYTVAEL